MHLQFSVAVGSKQMKHAGQAMHETGVPVVCWSDTSVSGTATYVSLRREPLSQGRAY